MTKKKWLGLISAAALLLTAPLYAETVSVDNTFVAGDNYANDFHTRLNRDIVQLMNGINNVRGVYAGSLPTSGQIGADTIGLENLADEIDPAIRLTENFSEYVESGLLPVTSANLSTTIASGTAYPEGRRVNRASSTNRTFTASADTYVDIDINSNFQYTEVGLGAAAPAVATNSVRIARVSADGVAVRQIFDLRDTTLVNESQTEAVSGFKMTFVSGDQFTVTSGRARDRSNNDNLTTTATTTVDLDTSGINGLDTGSKAASTWYYLFVAGDQPGSQTTGFLLSTSNSAPTLPVNYDRYRRIGVVRTNASVNIASFDQSGLGATRIYSYRERQNAADYSAANPGTANQTVTASSQVPISVTRVGRFIMNVEDNNANGAMHIRSNAYAGTPGYLEFDLGASPISETLFFDIYLDSSGQFVWNHDGGPTNISMEFDCVGFEDEI